MNPTARLEMSILGAALTLGVLGDVLLRCFPWGMNFALWATLFAVAIVFLGRARRRAFAEGGGWLLLPVAISPSVFIWHDSPPLKALNLLALLTALSLAMLRVQGCRLRVSSLWQYALGSLLAGFNAMLGILPFLERGSTSAAGDNQPRKPVAVLLGMGLAIPPLVVFGGLFMGADAVFCSLVLRYLRTVPSHVAIVALVTYGVGGYLRGLLFGKELNIVAPKRPLPIFLGAIETGMMLGLLDLLFLAFVAVQIRYFFGGSALVQSTTGLTYAEYARRGFFELVTVAALVMPLLLFAHWALRPGDVQAQRLFQWLAGIEIALLFIVMASAVQRMRLYQAEYGLSEQRFYPTAFMGWLAVVFVWFCLTVLRGHRESFAFGAMVAGLLLIATLHALNPDALIARTNLARAQAGRIFDARYAARLSADAVPDLVAGLPVLSPQDRCTLVTQLLEHWSPPENPDWRSWGFSRERAWQAVRQNASTLRAACNETSENQGLGSDRPIFRRAGLPKPHDSFAPAKL